MIKYILLPLLGMCFLLGASQGYAQKARGSKEGRAKAAAKRNISKTEKTPALPEEKPLEGSNALPEGTVPAVAATAEQAQAEGANVPAGQAQPENQSAKQASDAQPSETAKTAQPAAELAAEAPGEGFVVQREEVTEEKKLSTEPRVVFNPKNQRDPTLSPDDLLILAHREQMRLAAIEAERQRKLAEERRKREEAERQRLLELERLKDPTKDVRNKIRVSGVIGQEVFIGDKIYTVGNTVFGARIIEVTPDYVVFSYKGHQFRRNVKL